MKDLDESKMPQSQRRNRRRRFERQELKGLGAAHKRVTADAAFCARMPKSMAKAMQRKAGVRPKKLGGHKEEFVFGRWATVAAARILQAMGVRHGN